MTQARPVSNETSGLSDWQEGATLFVVSDNPALAPEIESITGVRTVLFPRNKKVALTATDNPAATFLDVDDEAEATELREQITALRTRWLFAPVILLTQDLSDDSFTLALDCGANDVVQRPLRPLHLMARLQMRLRDTAEKQGKSVYQVGDLSIDAGYRLIKTAEKSRYLSATELNLLLALLENRGTTVARHKLKQRGWGQTAVTDNALQRRVCEIRKALREVESTLKIRTVYGVGFVLDHPIARG